jgi:modulator of FtsH protease
MIPTAIGALIGVSVPIFTTGIMGFIIMMIGAYFLMFMVQRNRNSFAGILWLMVFTLFMGFLMGPLLQIALRIPNGSQLVIMAALLTSGVFFIMTLIGYTTKRDTNNLLSFVSVGMFVLIALTIANIWLHSPVLHLVLLGGIVVASSIYIVWQVNQIVTGGETNYISAALVLYIQLYNLFTSILQILIALSGNDRR